jgi:formate--tetrahydrofolate ligase
MAQPKPILEVADELGVDREHVLVYGRDKAKIDLAALERPPIGRGRLVLVTAINPTPAGEGKTTTSIGLAMGLRRLGRRAVLALREPSLGPVFGVKGGGTGGGRASLVPADAINLHFTGDLHAITAANNLLSAMIDNALHFGVAVGEGGSKGRIDARSVTWARALDMNDRALRGVLVGLGGKTDGVPRQDRFDITAASEVMAVLAMAEGFGDLRERLARIVVGASETGEPVTAADLRADGAMTALLKDALLPNLVQTAEGGPALVHAGPFANIAHGCNSIVATRLALALGDDVVTEAGFGLDLGGEKFLDIKARALGTWPRLAVLVATLRALKSHGGVPAKQAKLPDAAALERGLPHLVHHLGVLRDRGLPAVVALNRFPDDDRDELDRVIAIAREHGAEAVVCEGFARGGEGAIDLATVVRERLDASDAAPPAPRYTYELTEALPAKVSKIARTFYGARSAILSPRAERDLVRLRKLGAESLPVCVAKTQLSLTDDPTRIGRPEAFDITVRELRLSAGAGFVVALTGDMMTMPGLPREPAACGVRIEADGRIRGLMQND